MMYGEGGSTFVDKTTAKASPKKAKQISPKGNRRNIPQDITQDNPKDIPQDTFVAAFVLGLAGAQQRMME